MAENRHTSYDLAQMQSLPLDIKISMTKRRIQEWYNHFEGNVHVSFSGGKDSTVLKHIVDSMYSDVESVFVNTGLEYPEIQEFVRTFENVTILRPKMNFKEVIEKYGYPVISKEVAGYIQYARRAIRLGIENNNFDYKKLNGLMKNKDGTKSPFNCEKWKFMLDAPFKCSKQCCTVMKKNPIKKYEKETGKKPITATMASESRLRKESWIKNGCNSFSTGMQISNPMSFWTENDVLEYIVRFNVPYAKKIYGDIILNEKGKYETTKAKRTGCIFCMFGVHLEKYPNRFQMLEKSHPKQYKYCINGGEYVDGVWQPSKDGLGLAKVLDYIGVEYTDKQLTIEDGD